MLKWLNKNSIESKEIMETYGRKRFVTYAQDCEDLILFHALKYYVKKGKYLDVGANHPINNSVTKSFYERGWNGINIEPQSDLVDLLDIERVRDINLGVAIGSSSAKLQLFGHGESWDGTTTMGNFKGDYRG